MSVGLWGTKRSVAMAAAALLLGAELLMGGCTAANQAAQGRAGVSPAASDQNAQAVVLYKRNCAACHGVQLEGRAAVRLQHEGARRTREEILGFIHDGTGTMPAFGKLLGPEEVNKLADWLASKK